MSPEIENYWDLGLRARHTTADQNAEAVEILNVVHWARLEHLHGTYLALRLRDLLALAWLNAGERDRALTIFHEVATVAAPAGVCQSIVDQGPEIGLVAIEAGAHRAAAPRRPKRAGDRDLG